ncbi:MAG: peptidoglycan glycosyltransferase, partial [Christensenellaceae bacterium]|nr:peptidoglycan glycosyltransferase [Christensenellaceae bacterium]
MKRLLAIILLITFLFIAILARLIYIGIVDGQKLYTLALDQWTRDVPITARRGSIFDRSGIVLADSYSTYTLYVRPVEITDHEKTAKTLGELTGLTEKEISKKIIKKSSEVLISKNLSKEVMLKILKSG